MSSHNPNRRSVGRDPKVAHSPLPTQVPREFLARVRATFPGIQETRLLQVAGRLWVTRRVINKNSKLIERTP